MLSTMCGPARFAAISSALVTVVCAVAAQQSPQNPASGTGNDIQGHHTGRNRGRRCRRSARQSDHWPDQGWVTSPDAVHKCCTLRRPLEVPLKSYDVDLNAADYEKAVQQGMGATEKLTLSARRHCADCRVAQQEQ